MHVANGEIHFDRRAICNGVFGASDQFVIQRLVETMILRLHAMAGNAAGQRRIIENG